MRAARHKPAEDRLAGLKAANGARAEARLERMAALANFAIEVRQKAPRTLTKTVAHDFAREHGIGEASARAMLTELERLGFVPRKEP